MWQTHSRGVFFVFKLFSFFVDSAYFVVILYMYAASLYFGWCNFCDNNDCSNLKFKLSCYLSTQNLFDIIMVQVWKNQEKKEQLKLLIASPSYQ